MYVYLLYREHNLVLLLCSDCNIIILGVPCLQNLRIHNVTEYEYSDSLPPKLRQVVSNHMIATKEFIPVITVGLHHYIIHCHFNLYCCAKYFFMQQLSLYM